MTVLFLVVLAAPVGFCGCFPSRFAQRLGCWAKGSVQFEEFGFLHPCECYEHSLNCMWVGGYDKSRKLLVPPETCSSGGASVGGVWDPGEWQEREVLHKERDVFKAVHALYPHSCAFAELLCWRPSIPVNPWSVAANGPGVYSAYICLFVWCITCLEARVCPW